ncbi:hypothetical protein EDB85DRAFT_1894857 [Lactarius pseudohatsudake]|nr:hypothetical protein EDB85DRAFT_1894857 [Lactarius pseudohatsudake]
MSKTPEICTFFGAAFLGLLVNTTLFGVTISQTNYRDRDPKPLKFFVAFITFMDASNTLVCAYVIYCRYLILHFGDIETLSSSMWALNLQIILCRSYHARRVLIVTQSIICVIAVVVLVAIGCVTSIFIAAKQSSLKRFSGVHSSVWLTCVGLSTVALGDILVATSICWCLYQKRTRIARTHSVLVTIVAYSVYSSLLTRDYHGSPPGNFGATRTRTHRNPYPRSRLLTAVAAPLPRGRTIAVTSS